MPSHFLSAAELDELATFLRSHPDGVNTLEALDGLLTAMIVGPDRLTMDECLPMMLGTVNPTPPSDTTRAVMDRLWEGIRTRLVKGEDIQPLRSASDHPIGQVWANAFLMGTRLLPDSPWQRLADSDQDRHLVRPIVELAVNGTPDGASFVRPNFNPDVVLECDIPVAVADVYYYFGVDRGDHLDASEVARTWEAGVISIASPSLKAPARLDIVAIVDGLGMPVRISPNLEPTLTDEEIPDRIAQAVTKAIRGGGQPTTIIVAQLATKQALEREPELVGITVVVREEMPLLDGAAHDIREKVAAGPRFHWTRLGLPAETVGAICATSAALYRAQPWGVSEQTIGLTIELATGERWVAMILPPMGSRGGVIFLTNPDDFTMFLYPRLTPALGDHEGAVVTILFGDAEQCPRGLAAEIDGNGWAVAAPEAYPELMVVNTAAGLTATLADTLLAMMAALIGFVRSHERLPRQWQDPATKATVTFSP